MITFSKMELFGRNYICVNALDQTVPEPGDLVKKLLARPDGMEENLLLILPSSLADYRIRFYSAFGAEQTPSDSALFCAGNYLYASLPADQTGLALETCGGIRSLSLRPAGPGGCFLAAKTEPAILSPRLIPMRSDDESFISRPVDIGDKTFSLTCVSVGRPYAVLFVPDPDAPDLADIGPALERHPLFPNRIGSVFVRSIDRVTLRLRVWEQNDGEGSACFAGMCAGVAAAVLEGRCNRNTPVRALFGEGELLITYLPGDSLRMEISTFPPSESGCL